MTGFLIMLLALVYVTHFFWIRGLRDVDEWGPGWMTGRWRPHRVLPWVALAGFAILVEFSATQGTWNDFKTSELIQTNAGEVEGGEAPLDPTAFPRLSAGEWDVGEQIRLLREWREKQEAMPRRPLRAWLAPEDRAGLDGAPDVLLRVNEPWQVAFSVTEDGATPDQALASGWFARLLGEGRQARYRVHTWCGFDLTVTPPARTCFSTMPAPVFLRMRFPDAVCDLPRRRELTGRTRTRSRIAYSYDPCQPRARMPWLAIRMTREGVETLAYLNDSAPELHEAFRDERADTGRRHLFRASLGAESGGPVPWQSYVDADGTVPVKVTPLVEGGEIQQLWSRRHMTRHGNRKTMELGVEWQPFTGVDARLTLPVAHIAAADFLGYRVPGVSDADWHAAISWTWPRLRPSQDPAVFVSRFDSCMRNLDTPRRDRALDLGARPPRNLRDRADKMMPGNVYLSDRKCGQIVPIFAEWSSL